VKQQKKPAPRRKRTRRVAAPTFDERLRYTMDEASALLRQSVAKTWVDAKQGRIALLRDGGRTYVPGSEIARRSRLETPSAGAPAGA